MSFSFRNIVPRSRKGNVLSGGKFPLGMDAEKTEAMLSSSDHCILFDGEGSPSLSEIATDVALDREGWFPPQPTGGSGGSEQVVGGGNPSWGSLPFVGTAALVITQVPFNATCQTAANASTPNLSPIDHLHSGRYAAYKGVTLPAKTDVAVAHEVGLSWVENMRKATLGNIHLVDKNGKLGVDVFQGEEWVAPHDTIRCYGKGTYNRFTGYAGVGGYWRYFSDKINNDSRFDDYSVIYHVVLGDWNVSLAGSFYRGNFPPWQVISQVNQGPGYQSWANCPILNFSPEHPNFDISCWERATNIWDLGAMQKVNALSRVHLHEVAHSIISPAGYPNEDAVSHGCSHGWAVGGSQMDSLPCVFTDTGPKGVHCNIETQSTTGLLGQMNIIDAMNGANLACIKPSVNCTKAPAGYQHPQDYWQATLVTPGYWAFTDLLDPINVVDLTPIDQTAPGVIFEDWLYAGDVFWMHPDLQSLGSRKVVITQEMHTDLPYPPIWDTAVGWDGLPRPKKRIMHLYYYARGDVLEGVSLGGTSLPADGQIYLSWGPCLGNTAGFNNMFTFERMDVDPANPSPPLIINGFDTETPANSATRFNGWKVEIIEYGPGARSRKSKVKIRITSLGDTGA